MLPVDPVNPVKLFFLTRTSPLSPSYGVQAGIKKLTSVNAIREILYHQDTKTLRF
jgi:hypothetical protein